MGIIRMEIGSVRLVILMINYASAERLGWRQRRSWICDMERNKFGQRSGHKIGGSEVCLGSYIVTRGQGEQRESRESFERIEET